MTREVAIYIRVSSDKQDATRQKKDLQDWADRAGHKVIGLYEDTISGTKDSRPALDQLMKDVRRHKVKFIAVTELSRLGRSMQHLLNLVQELQDHGCDIWVDKEALDTSTAMGKAFFHMTALFAEFERNLLAERTASQLATIKEEITRTGRYRAKNGNVIERLGRPGADPAKTAQAAALLSEGKSIRTVAKATGLGVGTVHRIKAKAA